MMNFNKIHNFFISRIWNFFLLVLLLLITYYLSKIDTITLSDFHIDGAFQNYNGLSRLARSEKVGVDFFLYLGPGLYYMLLPFYLLFGADFSASMLASDFVMGLLPFIIIFILLKSLKIMHSIPFTILVLTLIILKINLFDPGVSLRSFRDIPSYLPAFLFLLIGIKDLEKRLALMSFTVGLLSTFSPASSAAAIISYGLFIFFILIKKFKDHFFKKSFLMIGSFILGILSMWFLYGHDGFMGNLDYMLFDISQNQKWLFSPYFGGYSTLGLYIKSYFLLIFLLACTIVRKRTIESFLILTISISLFLTGFISSLKGHLSLLYFRGFEFFSSFFIFLFLIHLIFDKYKTRIIKNISLLDLKKNNSVIFLNICTGSLLIYCTFICFFQYSFIRNFVEKNENFFFVSELGGYLNKKNQGTVEYVRKNKSLVFLEEYSGIPMAILKQKPITNVDSIIHAMGKKRYSFRQEVEKNKADIVTSSNPVKTAWINWNMAQNWYFYKNLFLNYQIDYKGSRLLFWKKGKEKLKTVKVNCKVNNQEKRIIINNGISGFYSVLLNYKFKKGDYLLADINLPFKLDKNLSLPLHLNSFEFPVNLKGMVSFETVPKEGKNNLTLISCSARDFTAIIPFKQSELMFKVRGNETLYR